MTPPLRYRAALALVLWAGFPILGVLIVAAFLWLPAVEMRFGRLEPLGVVSAGCAAVVAWALVPRLGRPLPPGVPVPRERYPALVALVDRVAADAGDRAPEELFVVPHANAMIGFRRVGLRRVGFIALGLPLLVDLAPDALASVIAHEMGHRRGGDLRLGPWIHGTSRSIATALDRLAGDGAVLELPFVWYGRLFLYLTRGVSRSQEIAADALAARLCGPGPTIAALDWVHGRGGAWDVYWRREVAPLLDRGVHPPILEGWRLFASGPDFDELVDAVRAGEPGEHDTHPPLAERIAAIGAHAPADPTGPGVCDPAIVDDLVQGMLVDPATTLTRLSWDEVARRVWLPLWAEEVEEIAAPLRRFTPRRLPDALADLDGTARALEHGIAHLTPEAARNRSIRLLSIGLALALADAGFEGVAAPGVRCALVRGDVRIDPFDVVDALRAGRLSPAEWRHRCDALTLP